jgi:hydroxyacylglutathione hydrolase
MIHEIIPVGPLQCNCSIIGDPATHEAIIVDPGSDEGLILQKLEEHELKTQLIVITHGHIDHVGGAMKLKRATGACVVMNQNDDDMLSWLDEQAAWLGLQSPGPVKIDSHVQEGSRIKIGNLEALVLNTPGHTEGSICLLLSAEKTLIAGDTLFAGGIGRTDLPGGSHEKLMFSLHQHILPLSDDIVVIPGHGPLTNIGRERLLNPYLNDFSGHKFFDGRNPSEC